MFGNGKVFFSLSGGGVDFAVENLTIITTAKQKFKKAWSRLMNRFHLQHVQHLKLVNRASYNN